MGKKIGIKLADGTFYPIMEDGVPQKKLMELTTVQDNQTTASIDLYRSESGTMDDAEYVDTLELSDLVPHPGGETSISFTIQLHEDDTLSAEVVDAESGNASATKIDLFNLPDERKHSSAAGVFDTDFEEPPLPEAPSNAFEESPQPEDFDSVGIADFNLPDFDLNDFSSVDSLPTAPVPKENDTLEENPFSDLATDTTAALSPFDLNNFSFDDFSTVEGNGQDATDDGATAWASSDESDDTLADFNRFDIPDFDAPDPDEFSVGEEAGLFDEHDFDDPAFHTTNTTSSASPLDFSGLYDDREGKLMQPQNRKGRGGVAVVVCVVCALVCVGILLFILFMLPSRFSDGAVAAVESHTVTVSRQEMEAQPDSAAAVEDVIVIVETPSVVPVPPQVQKASIGVRYQIKWGDTLWDIAQSYYNNPWLYKRIAIANNIRNPDYIIAGTILTIPPQ